MKSFILAAALAGMAAAECTEICITDCINALPSYNLNSLINCSKECGCEAGLPQNLAMYQIAKRADCNRDLLMFCYQQYEKNQNPAWFDYCAMAVGCKEIPADIGRPPRVKSFAEQECDYDYFYEKCLKQYQKDGDYTRYFKCA